FLEIYAPHKYPEGRRDAVMLSVRAWNPSASPASLTFAGSRLISLDARIWYQLLFECDEAGNGKFTLKEEDSQVAIENPTVGPEQLRRAKGRLIDGYRFPGMTIHEAGKNKLDFGMRVNGWSLPVTISQP
ncbi:MAG TPA: hypothetical protein VMV01_16215, partial [Planctomycetota bacterium]|nr:hypothetical protein [Planctomycetota bacterium]